MSRSRRAASYRPTLDAAGVRRQQLQAEAAVLRAISDRLTDLKQLAGLLAFVRSVPIPQPADASKGGDAQ